MADDSDHWKKSFKPKLMKVWDLSSPTVEMANVKSFRRRNSWWIQLLVPMSSDDFLSKRLQDTSGYLLLKTEELLLPFGLHKDLLATGRNRTQQPQQGSAYNLLLLPIPISPPPGMN